VYYVKTLGFLENDAAMKLNYRMQCLFASAIQLGVLITLATLLIIGPIYAEGEVAPSQTGSFTEETPFSDPTGDTTDAPTDGPTAGPTDAPTTPPTAPPKTGYIIANSLNVRENPSTTGKVVGYYVYADKVLILEEIGINGTPWGRTDKGWICMTYVDTSGKVPQPKPTEPKPTEPKPTTPKPTEPKPTEPKPTNPPSDSKLEDNPFKSSDFTKNGQFITCKKEKTVIGIDVSRWQEDIDWKKVKAAGVDYVMIRAGLRSTARAGTLSTDAYVEKHYQGAKAAGLKVGFYFFSQAKTVAEAREEARYLLNIVKNWDVDLPLACDWEYSKTTDRVYGLSRRRVTDCVKAFCDTIKAAGYDPMIYCARYIVAEKLYMEELADYALWYADYNSNYLRSEFRVDMWQYSCTGKISGIKGNVDLNVIFLENSVFSKYFEK
jgi:GH25 family lysozyme M1 (1,4-beta-N-acetylmuramidase)